MKALAGPGALAGVRVLEFSHVIAGPFTGLQLLQLGAEVTKVEPPLGGDFLATVPHGQRAYEALNAGKQLRRIDITQPAGLAEALALAEQADVLIDSFAPGSLARKGLGYEVLAARHPALVYCSISGYGSEHPAWGGRGAYDHVVQAMTGIARQNGQEGDPPIKVGFPVTDTATGMAAVTAIMAALMTRYRTGRGQYLEVSMARAALQLLFPMACDAAVTGIDAPRIGNTGYSGSPGAGFFETRDGWLALGANTAPQLERALRALGFGGEEAAVREAPAVGVVAGEATVAATGATRPAAPGGVAARLREAIGRLPAAEAEARLDAAGVPVARLRSLTEFLHDAVATGWLADGGHAPARWARDLALAWRAFEPGAHDAVAQPSPSPSPLAEACRRACIAFFPLYEMARLRHLALEDPANPRRHALHSLQHVRRLLDHTDRTVTAPNNDTLFSSARLDLRHGPVLIETPAMAGRYYSVQLMNGHSDNLAILGSRAAGDGPLQVLAVGPGWHGPVPPHSHRVDADTHDLWLLVRTLVDGPADLAAVAALQDRMRITAPRPAADYPRQQNAVPLAPQPEAFLRVVNEFLARNPPQGRMAAQAALARPLGIGAEAPAWAALPEAVRVAWAEAWPAATAALQDPARLVGRRVQGWDYPPPGIGQWGDDLVLRAAMALCGIAALDASEALYLHAHADADGAPLDGRQRYRVRIPAGGLPAQGFWSLSLYEAMPDGRYFFVPNPIGRHSVGNRSAGLRPQPDGSIELLLQQAAPPDTGHWLPAPAGPFRLTLRAYLPSAALVRGEVPLPRVERLAGPDSA